MKKSEVKSKRVSKFSVGTLGVANGVGNKRDGWTSYRVRITAVNGDKLRVRCEEGKTLTIACTQFRKFDWVENDKKLKIEEAEDAKKFKAAIEDFVAAAAKYYKKTEREIRSDIRAGKLMFNAALDPQQIVRLDFKSEADAYGPVWATLKDKSSHPLYYSTDIPCTYPKGGLMGQPKVWQPFETGWTSRDHAEKLARHWGVKFGSH